MKKPRAPSLSELAEEYRRKVREAEQRAMNRVDRVGTQDERWAIHAEHVKERVALTLEFLDKLPLEVAADQVEGVRKALRRQEQLFARTGKSYHQGQAELFIRIIAASAKRLEERKAEVGIPTSA